MLSPSIPLMSSERTTAQQSADQDEQVLLAEELSEREGIPIETAWSIVTRHHSPSVKGGTQNGTGL